MRSSSKRALRWLAGAALSLPAATAGAAAGDEDLRVLVEDLRAEVSLQRRKLEPLAVSIASPGDDRRRNQDEGRKRAGDDPPATLYAALRHARRRALRARGFRAISSSLAVTALRDTSFPSAWPRQVHSGCRGGQIHSRDHSRIACLTMRSSPE